MAEKKYAVWLSQVRGLGSKSRIALCQAVRDMGHCEDPARELYRMSEPDLHWCCQMAAQSEKRAEKLADCILQGRCLPAPDVLQQKLEEKEIRFVDIHDPAYPERLRNIPDPPYSLYYRGELPKDSRPSLAVIGARMATQYGRREGRRFCERLAAQGIQIVSGMAMGIDGIAGCAALDAGGTSFAVLGNGADICYPAQNRELYDRLICQGGVISEYPPGTSPQARLFPMRNRIISGLTDAVFVVEAKSRSGTLITVDMALDQGREVFAMPGRVCDALSYGCNRLISQGATIATCPEDILRYFYGADAESVQFQEQKRQKPDLPPVEMAVYSLLDLSDAADADTLTQMAEVKLGRRCSAREISTALMKLVLRGLAVETGIGHYIRA